MIQIGTLTEQARHKGKWSKWPLASLTTTGSFVDFHQVTSFAELPLENWGFKEQQEHFYSSNSWGIYSTTTLPIVGQGLLSGEIIQMNFQ